MRAVAALCLAFAAVAQAAPSASDEPPARVGRVSWMSGEVAIYVDPEHGWEKAYVNSPLTSQNSLWTEPGARAEVRIGPTTLRLEETTQLDIRRLDDGELRAHIVRGRMTLRIREFDRSERYVISTPQARFAITAAGRYRLDAEETTGQAVLTVFAGSAQVEAGRTAGISAGEAVRVREDGESFEFERVANTSFDDWAASRDDRVDRLVAETLRYVSPQMTGYEDLGEHGRWNTEPEYGAVWYPSGVGVDYVPYRDGHWAYSPIWGWTWIDHAPWGYAPFHYGRWVYVGNRWGWCPGRYVPRPVWAPALVGWVGGGSGFSVAVRGGRSPAMGWYPLSPYDHYRPWHTTNSRYINNVNVIVNRSPRGRENDRDRQRERGTTVVLREDFVRQRPVQQGIARVPGEAAREAVRGAPVATNPAQVLPPRTEARRPGGTVPFQAGAPAATRPTQQAGEPVRAQPQQPATRPPTSQPGAPVAPRVATPATPQFGAPVAPRVVTPAQQPAPSAPAATRPTQQAGEPVRAPQAQPQQPPAQQATPAPRRPSQPVELREDRPRPATPAPAQAGVPVAPRTAPPAPAQAGVPVAPRTQAQPQPQAQPPAAPRGEPAQGRPAPAPAPAPAAAPAATRPAPPPQEKPEKPEKPDKPEKPGTGREK